MTIEELNRKLERINTRLEGVISEMYVSYDKDKLERNVNALQNEILGDPRIKRILTEGTPEDRAAYMTAIENGAKGVRDQLAALRENDSMSGHRDELDEVHKDSNTQVFDVVSSIRDAERTDFGGRTSDYVERVQELGRKKQTIEGVLKTDESIANIKAGLRSAGRPETIAEMVSDVDSLITARNKYKDEQENCNDLIGVNLKGKVEELERLLGRPGARVTDDGIKSKIRELEKICRTFDAVDNIGTAPTQPLDFESDFKDGTRDLDLKVKADVDKLISNLKTKVANPDFKDILDGSGLSGFITEKREESQKVFSDKVDKSVVLTKMYTPTELDGIKTDLDAGLLTRTKKSLEEYEKYMGTGSTLNRATLELQKADIERKEAAYADLVGNKKQITVSGKSLIFTDDMIDPTVSEEQLDSYIEYIDRQSGASATEFRTALDQEISSKLTAMTTLKPTNTWLQNTLERFFGRFGYTSPETKFNAQYKAAYFDTAKSVLKEAITQNKEKFDSAEREVGSDTEKYRQKLIQKTVTDKAKTTRADKKKAKSELDAFEER